MDYKQILAFRSKLRIVERALTSVLKDETNCCGVGLAQCQVVLELAETDSISIRDLSARLKLDKSTLSRTVDQLVNSGLATSETDSSDRRYLKVGLTADGRKTAIGIDKMCNDYYASIFDVIPTEKQLQIIESLELLGNAMEAQSCCKISDQEKK